MGSSVGRSWSHAAACARCLTGSRPATHPPPAPARAVDALARWEGSGREWRLVLAGEWDAPLPEAPAPAAAEPLAYGESISAHGMTCTSDSTGVGFTVRRASVDFLGD